MRLSCRMEYIITFTDEQRPSPIDMYVYVIHYDRKVLGTVSFFTTSRYQLGAEFEGKKFHKNYLGKDGVISWICHTKTCNRRIRTQGPYVIEVSGTGHSSECLGFPAEN
ncbi:hypothetical protein HF086_014290 [Spodoptera exigua]|uniref:Uncharacterized protein n=1 Tax=Spodoptera exigua TaxID=7107 RepID=A0A922SBJ6_SPOEX|nr:hypothetical protein HF086_014290 [Spodoptera exigua]